MTPLRAGSEKILSRSNLISVRLEFTSCFYSSNVINQAGEEAAGFKSVSCADI
ncbi:MAG: hypothetical protein ACYSUB_14515 [Planctomycetota bacterium]